MYNLRVPLKVAGFTIVADKLNFFRYLSHFRAVHRGAFFAQMRTTGVRKLLPDAWGEREGGREVDGEEGDSEEGLR